MEALRRRSHHATVTLLITSVVLIGPALAGVGSTLPLAVVIGAFAGLLWQVRETLAKLPTVVGYDLGEHARHVWVGVLFGAVVVLGTLGTPPVELQAYGGLAGLVGMVNYFVRPLYLFLAASLGRLAGQ